MGHNHSRPKRNGASKFKGVSWIKLQQKWKAKIQFEGQTKHLGRFTDEIEAAKAYNTAALEYFGPDAYLNSFEEVVGPESGDTQQIPLTGGKFAKVDSIDYEFLMQKNWHISSGRTHRVIRSGGTRISMGCLILQRKFNQDDLGRANYIDGDLLNNCRDNLRPATASQSAMTRKPRKGVSSKFKGVSWATRQKRWKAYIQEGSKNKYLGSFTDEIEAAEAYNKAALELFGEFARINTFEEAVA